MCVMKGHSYSLKRKRIKGGVKRAKNLSSMASAAFDDHIAIFLQNDVGIVVKIQDGYGREFDRCTTGLRHAVRVHQMH